MMWQWNTWWKFVDTGGTSWSVPDPDFRCQCPDIHMGYEQWPKMALLIFFKLQIQVFLGCLFTKNLHHFIQLLTNVLIVLKDFLKLLKCLSFQGLYPVLGHYRPVLPYLTISPVLLLHRCFLFLQGTTLIQCAKVLE